MQQRVLTIQTLNEKLQVMFGLEPEKRADADVEGQGGEEVPYEAGASGIRDGESLAGDGTGAHPGNSGAAMAANIKKRLSWLERQTVREHHMLTRLEKAAGERADFWAATPVHLARQRPRVLKVWATHFTLYRQKSHSMRAWISVAHAGKPCEPPPKAK